MEIFSKMSLKVLLITLISTWLLLGAPSIASGQIPDTIFVVHCEPPNANPPQFVQLASLVQEAGLRNIKLTIDFTPSWADMILGDPPMLAQVRSWQLLGHEIGGHHHSVEAPGVWDGYTDLRPGTFYRPEPYLGTMADYKALLDQLVGSDGLKSGCIPSSDYELPYGVLHITDGHDVNTHAVSQPSFEIHNKYGVWFLGHGLLSNPPDLVDLKALHAATSSPDVLGAVTHVFNYAGNPSLITDWFDYLAGVDPLGTHSKTVSEILSGYDQPLEADTGSFPAATGGTVNLDLTTDSSLAGDDYVVVLSLSGGNPGYDWHGVFDDGVHMGINPDAYTHLCLAHANNPNFVDFQGILSSSGEASAAFDTLGPVPPAFIGTTITFIAVALDTGDVVFSSNPVEVEIL